MNPHGNMDDLDPLVSGFGKSNRKLQEMEPVPTEPEFRVFYTPGFHRQSNGMLAFVPDMQKLGPRYGPVPEEIPTQPEPEEDLSNPDFPCNARVITQPGVYLVEHGNGSRYVRWFDGTCWRNGRAVEAHPVGKVADLCHHDRGEYRSNPGYARVLGKSCLTPEQIRSGHYTLRDLLYSVTMNPKANVLTFPCTAAEVTRPGLFFTKYGQDCVGYKYTDGKGKWSNGYDGVNQVDEAFAAFLREDAAMDNGYVPTHVLYEVRL